MTTLQSLKRSINLFVLSCLIFFFGACKKDIQKESTTPENIDGESMLQWTNLLQQLDPGSNIIIVQKDGSIQDALNAAKAGDAIYLEPGTYREAININKPVKLIGLTGLDKEKVILDRVVSNSAGKNVEFINIEIVNSSEKISTTSLLTSNQSKKQNGLIDIERTELGNGVAHYQFKVCMGPGQFDVVRIHRVVREHRPFHPIRTNGDVFMVHGASQDFDDIFLTAGSETINAQTSSPFYLATNNIDVWGIDLAWTLVPVETTDFSFMKDWGVEKDVNHVLTAMSIARLFRGLTNQGFGRTNLLGFSYGATVVYAAAGRETQQHPILRDIHGIISVDGLMKYDPADETSRLASCAQANAAKNDISNGIYQNQQGKNLKPFGTFAISAPGDPSPIIPGMNNFSAGLFPGTSTYAFPNPLGPFWHFIGGDLPSPGAIPFGPLYTDAGRWFQLLSSLAPYQPQLTVFETRACACNDVNVTIDDHLDDISVPILYLGAGGGFGTLGYYTTGLLASEDITKITVSQQSVPNRFKDYGHADLFMGQNASTLVWQELRQWLVTH